MPWLPHSLEALEADAADAGVALEIVAVDNGSDDGSLDLLHVRENVQLVCNPVNVGFALAVAQGTALARAPWLLLINADAIVQPGFFAAMGKATQNAPSDAASFVPDTRFMSEPSRVNHRGLTVDEIGLPHERAAGLTPDQADREPSPLLGGSGGAVLLHAAALDRIGGFEPAYFAYFEDVDVAWRLQRAGFSAQFVPDAVTWHAGSGSSGVDSPVKAYLVGRNRLLLTMRHGAVARPGQRFMIEAAHGIVQALFARHIWGIRGRVGAVGRVRYARFLRAVDRDLGLVEAKEVPRAPAPPLLATLTRKLRVTRAMRAADKG